MVLSKCLRVLEKSTKSLPYSVLLEHRNKSETLLFESQAIAILSSQETEVIRKNYIKIVDAYGCLGVLQLHAGDDEIMLFLVLVTSCDSIGKISDCEIFRITQTRFISLQYNEMQNSGHHHQQSPSSSSSTYEEKLNEVQQILNSGTFYFAWHQHNNTISNSNNTGNDNGGGTDKIDKLKQNYTFDITLSAQRRLRSNETDNRFFWNRTLYIHLLRYGVDCKFWLLKILCGSIDIRTVYAGSRQARTAIISRLSCERAGTRFIVRGTNDDGHVANFVETEQVIYLDNEITSYVQTRGSIPLFWEQPGIQVGSHKIKFSRGYEASTAAFNRHMAMMTAQYGKYCIINLLGTNLIGSKEGEATLSNEFQRHHQESEYKNVPHIVFDYHQQCRNRNKKVALNELKCEIQMYANQYGLFHMTYNSQTNDNCNVIKEQLGTFRVNCLDCLDRTNCVQTFLGLEVLADQIQLLGFADKKQNITRFEDVFHEMWINNGNEISKIYAGTGAIQGSSKLMDGARSAARTIQNNLLDNSKQEGFDILLFGSTLNDEYSDYTRTLLPTNMLCTPAKILQEMCHRSNEFIKTEELKIACGTYNVNGGKHFRSVAYKDVSLNDWLFDSHRSMTGCTDPIDIYAIGFQEIVDLNASNIMAASSDNAKLWTEELQKTLSTEDAYTLLTYQQLVGVCLFIFIRSKHAVNVRDVAVDCVKTGLGGATGNKGAVAIRLQIHATSICFVCAHFAAGQSQISERNSDYAEITRKISFPPIAHSLQSHDYVFWCGDFNYRIDMDKENLKELIKLEDFNQILANDQLSVQKELGHVFNDFNEGNITFPPTYKYDLFSDDYDTSEKCRAPAWTDRVLWRRKKPTSLSSSSTSNSRGWFNGKLLYYGRADLKQSDHRPVIAVIAIEISKIDETLQNQVFNQIVKDLGPPDSTIVIHAENNFTTNNDMQDNNDPNIIYDENIMNGLIQQLMLFGEVTLVRYVGETLWITFRHSQSTLAATERKTIIVSDIIFHLKLKTENWLNLIEEEIGFCTTNTVPFYDYDAFSGNSLNKPKVQPPPRPVNSPKRPPPPTRPPMPIVAPTKQLSKAGIISITPNMLQKTTIITNTPQQTVPTAASSNIITTCIPDNKELNDNDKNNYNNQSIDIPEEKEEDKNDKNIKDKLPESLPPPTTLPPPPPQQSTPATAETSVPNTTPKPLPPIPSRLPPVPTRNDTVLPRIPTRNDVPPIPPRK